MSKFVITGNADEVSAQLKAAFEADEARFKASLDSLFKPAPPRPQPAPAVKAPPAYDSHETSGWTLSRKDDRGGSPRSRGARIR